MGVCRTVTALQTARNESVLDHEHNVCCGGEREREKKGVTMGENLFLSSVTQKIESK